MQDLEIQFGDGLMTIKLLVKETFQISMIWHLLEKEELEIAQSHLCIVTFL